MSAQSARIHQIVIQNMRQNISSGVLPHSWAPHRVRQTYQPPMQWTARGALTDFGNLYKCTDLLSLILSTAFPSGKKARENTSSVCRRSTTKNAAAPPLLAKNSSPTRRSGLGSSGASCVAGGTPCKCCTLEPYILACSSHSTKCAASLLICAPT